MASEPTLTEFRVRYHQSVFRSKHLQQLAAEALCDDLQEVHDSLVTAAKVYIDRAQTVRNEALKAFPDEAVTALRFPPEPEGAKA